MNIIKKMFSNDNISRDFYKMLYEQSAKTLEGIEYLYKYIISGQDEDGDKVIEIEQQADELRRILISSLEQTFITPFEREDIYNLSRTIDDVIDYSASTVEELRLFNLGHDDNLKEMVRILYEASKALNDAVLYLKDHKDISAERLVQVKFMENQIEKVYRNALAELFNKDDYKYIFTMREIYRHISNAADKGDEAANIIGHIIVKMT